MEDCYLTDSLSLLGDLKTLNLDLHYACNISGTLGPAGILNLSRLPDLQTLAVPFHFFIRIDSDGNHRVVNPARVLPPTLETLRIVACLSCLEFWICKKLDREDGTYHHWSAITKFLERIADSHHESFPNLRTIVYDEGMPEEGLCTCKPPQSWLEYNSSQGQPCTFHLTADSHLPRLAAVVLALYLRGVSIKPRMRSFQCPLY